MSKHLSKFNQFLSDEKKSDLIMDEANRIIDRHLGHYGNCLIQPQIEVMENEKEINITAELPGLKAENIDLNINDEGVLTISAEKQNERENKGKGYYFSERSYGLVQRKIALPDNVDLEKINADFKNGILEIEVPKIKSDKEKTKKIPIKEK